MIWIRKLGWLGVFLLASCANMQKTHYADFISKYEEERDFRILVQDRDHPITVLAIHGGRIELHTSEIARALAGEDWNLYLFEGIMDSGNSQLHLTSHQFDEPRATELARRSRLCFSVHGFREPSARQVCLGGKNQKLRALVFAKLRESGLIDQTEENPCGKFLGVEPSNVVNLCEDHGVQLEISSALREHLAQTPDALKKFRAALQSAAQVNSAAN